MNSGGISHISRLALPVVRVAAILLALSYLLIGLNFLANDLWPDPTHQGVIGGDFSLHYAAGEAAREGAAAEIYDHEKFLERQRKYAGNRLASLNWHYPPTTLFAVLPLPSFDFVTARLLWIAAGLLLFAVAFNRTIAAGAGLLALLLLHPAVIQNLVASQNGLIAGALTIAGLALVDRRPLLAGIFIGLLTLKPQLGLLIPFALMAGGYWRSFFAAVATTFVLFVLSILIFGVEAWLAFAGDAIAGGGFLEVELKQGWYKMPTVFAGARGLGLSQAQAWSAQAAATLVTIVLIIRAWRGAFDFRWKLSVLLLALPLAVPYAQFYDTAFIAAPLAFAVLALDQAANRRFRETFLALAYLSPAVLITVSELTILPVLPLFQILLLWLFWQGQLLPRN